MLAVDEVSICKSHGGGMGRINLPKMDTAAESLSLDNSIDDAIFDTISSCKERVPYLISLLEISSVPKRPECQSHHSSDINSKTFFPCRLYPDLTREPKHRTRRPFLE